jgi:hypothetical protein
MVKMEPKDSADPPESVVRLLPPDPTPALSSPTSALAKPSLAHRDPRDPEETMEPPENRDQEETMDSPDLRDLVDPPDHLDQLDNPETVDNLVPQVSSAPLPQPHKDAPVPLVAPETVEAQDSLVAQETMDAPDPLDHKENVDSLVPLVAQEAMANPESPVSPEPQEAATTAHPLVWPLDIKPTAERRRTTAILDFLFVFLSTTGFLKIQ